MRRLFLILMIALLPLRGWIGDVMAVEMSLAHQNVVATKSIANYLYSTWEKGVFTSEMSKSAVVDCPGHAAMVSAHPATGQTAAATVDTIASSDTNMADDATANGHCNTCSSCQICHSVALASVEDRPLPGIASHRLPHVGSTRFASAFAALSQKPPIA